MPAPSPVAPSPTSLRSRLLLTLALPVLASLFVAAAAFWGLQVVHRDMGTAVRGYQEMREAYEVGLHAALARAALSEDRPDPQRALSEIRTARARLDIFSGSTTTDRRWLDASRDAEQSLRAALAECQLLLEMAMSSPDTDPRAARTLQLAAVDRAIARVTELGAAVRTAVAASEAGAESKRTAVSRLSLALAAAVLLATAAAGLLLYRRVVRPLVALRAATQRIAAGNFADRVDESGDREFAALAADFNGMADELEAIHRDLARQVEARTQELLRSKRLASVGYLAAGVAHEINNPLGIISGYGERSLRDLQRRDLTADTAGRIEQSLRIVCEEAFRCKAITEQLLALARPRAATTARRPTDLARVAEQVAAAVRGLDTLAQRELRTLTRPGDDCTVLADPGELHQVLLNLVVNAVEATDPTTGQIRLELARTDTDVTLTITDNGRGIPEGALPLLFEPFYTHHPPDAPSRGTGLGLTIARAIAEDLGGTLTANSAGPNQGSQFTLKLLAAPQQAGAERRELRDPSAFPDLPPDTTEPNHA